ncbi:hypothetical protein [Pseudoduganella violacea]|uniref:PEP-CTERM sorting domain-containing protein n=1 Tax=Pseudoduganella violacea TaxID=1715466 RepID=A0A7W5FU94_9BURK|nr:hypothetical protein [Pseudoduganella violacea]MBB3119497.1 hypothetical protein [Pseudoduganella violacea]
MVKEVLLVLALLASVPVAAEGQAASSLPLRSDLLESAASKEKPAQKPERASIPEERVPEPSPMAILATILLGLALVRMKH